MKCDICGKGIEDGALFRVNEIGVLPGIFRHRVCGPSCADIDPELATLVGHIEKLVGHIENDFPTPEQNQEPTGDSDMW